MVPELKGNPRELTKNSSKAVDRLTIPGIITYMIMLSTIIEITRVSNAPLVVGLYFLK